jgi:hypothetical protein
MITSAQFLSIWILASLAIGLTIGPAISEKTRAATATTDRIPKRPSWEWIVAIALALWIIGNIWSRS